jgi:hypothetical protein
MIEAADPRRSVPPATNNPQTMKDLFTPAEHHALHFFKNVFDSERELLKLDNTREAFISYYKEHVEPLGLGNAIATRAFDKLAKLNDDAWRDT